MRVLFIIHQFMPEFSTGTERVTLNIAKTLQRGGHHVDVLTSSVRGPSFWMDEANGLRLASVEGIRVHGLLWKNVGSGDVAALWEHQDPALNTILESFLDRGDYDIVHITHPMRMLLAIELVRQRSIPYVITLTDFFTICHRINLFRLDGTLCAGPEQGKACRNHCLDPVVTTSALETRFRRLRPVLLGASDVVACSDFVADVFRREFPDLQIRVINHGIDLLRYRPGTRERGKEPIVFGYVGTLSEAKGAHVLVEAFARAAPKNARLELIGSAYEDHSFSARLRSMCNSNTTLKGAMEHKDLPQALAGFDVFCLPSLGSETFSLSLHEGFAAGLPCLVSDIGWPAEVVRKSQCGRTIKAGDVHAWCDEIKAISANPSLLSSWTKNIPLPVRVEEEGFYYSQLYRRAKFINETVA